MTASVSNKANIMPTQPNQKAFGHRFWILSLEGERNRKFATRSYSACTEVIRDSFGSRVGRS